MDPLTMIATALVAGAAAAMKDTAAQVIKDAYNGIKNLLARKYPNAALVSAVLAMVESKPHDATRRQMLEDELKAAKVDQDGDVLKQAQVLGEVLKQYAPQIAQQYQVN